MPRYYAIGIWVSKSRTTVGTGVANHDLITTG